MTTKRTEAPTRGGIARILPVGLVGVGAFLLTIAIALVFFVVPGQQKTPLDVDSTTVTNTVPAAVLVGKDLASKTPTESNRDRPECKAEGDKVLPVSCYIDNDVPMYSQRRVTVVDPSDSKNISVQAAQSVIREDTAGSDGKDGLVNASLDRITLDRVSAEPIGEPTSTVQMITSGNPASDPAPTGFVREGLQYKFPVNTEKRDYNYFDMSTFTVNPIRFVTETSLNGVPVYEFKQDIGPIDMFAAIREHFAKISTGYDKSVESILASYRLAGMEAGAWGLSGDPKRQVTMNRFYTNTRTLHVNPSTGQIIDGKEDILQFFAENKQEADAFFANKAGLDAERKEPSRTAFRFSSGWNEKSIATAADYTQKNLDKLNTFGRVVPAILAILGVLGIAAGVVLMVRGGGRSSGTGAGRASERAHS